MYVLLVPEFVTLVLYCFAFCLCSISYLLRAILYVGSDSWCFFVGQLLSMLLEALFSGVVIKLFY